jgi:hypothetical protein
MKMFTNKLSKEDAGRRLPKSRMFQSESTARKRGIY